MRRGIRTRLAIATGALVAGTAALTIGVVYWAAVSRVQQANQAAAHQELESLLSTWRSGGIEALTGDVDRREHDPASQGFAYLIVEELSLPVAGNVRAWPDGMPEESHAGLVPLEVRRSNVYLVRAHRLESVRLDAKRSLLVGRDSSGEAPLVAALQIAALGALAFSLLLAIGAGLAMSRRLLGRVEDMHGTIAAIRSGRRDGRVAVTPTGDEFDELAAQFNGLLDENDRLVAQVRGVTNDIAHDLRTPLQRMQGRLEAALAAPSTPPDARWVLEGLAVDTERLLDTFNGLLQLVSLESGDLRRTMAPIDVEAVVREVADLYVPLAEEAGITLRAAVEPGVQLTADRQLLAQAIANLVDNAVKYGAGGGAIEVGARRVEDGVEIVVADRGPGIPEEARERVLDRLVRLDASRGVPGTGLGLSLVAAVARLHGGSIRLEDHRPGVRAVLRLHEPVDDAGSDARP